MAVTLETLKQDIYLALVRRIYKTKEGLPRFPDEADMEIRRLFPNNTIVREINNAQDFVIRQSECLQGMAIVVVPAGTYWFYIWDKSLSPIELLWNDADITGWRILEPIASKETYERSSEWETDGLSNSPTRYIYYRQQRSSVGIGQSIRLYPVPYKPGTLRLRCLRLPEVFTPDDDAALCMLEGVWYKSIIDYVCYTLAGSAIEVQNLGMLLREMGKESRSRDKDEKLIINYKY